VCALEHLHNENTVYRTWNMENILVDEDGHLAFVDFQFSKQLDGPTYTLCGLPEFMAPEMIENQGHTQVRLVDSIYCMTCVVYIISRT
jgi:serine/threonine protein kinase